MAVKDMDKEVITICDDLKPLKFARTMPFAFTEHGVAVLSGVLNSERAIRQLLAEDEKNQAKSRVLTEARGPDVVK